MTAMGQANALAVAVGDKGCFLNAPDMAMEKLIVGLALKALSISICRWKRNLQYRRALDKPLGELTVTVLAKPRRSGHCPAQQLGVRVFAILMATSRPLFSPACRIAKSTYCTASAARRKGGGFAGW